MIGRALTHRKRSRMRRLLKSPGLILQRSIIVGAPVEEVYDFWKDLDNYPCFMSFVQKVQVNDTGGLRWTVAGPAGLTLDWDAELKALLPNQIISWKSLPKAKIRQEGRVRFTSLSHGRTRVEIYMSYASPAGVVGLALSHWLGFDPSQKIDEDLEVMKRLIEGSTSLRTIA